MTEIEERSLPVQLLLEFLHPGMGDATVVGASKGASRGPLSAPFIHPLRTPRETAYVIAYTAPRMDDAIGNRIADHLSTWLCLLQNEGSSSSSWSSSLSLSAKANDSFVASVWSSGSRLTFSYCARDHPSSITFEGGLFNDRKSDATPETASWATTVASEFERHLGGKFTITPAGVSASAGYSCWLLVCWDDLVAAEAQHAILSYLNRYCYHQIELHASFSICFKA